MQINMINLNIIMIVGIVAFCQNQGISFQDNIPWYISEDLKFFKSITSNSIVVMGRKTFESIGHPLVGRLNIVITNSPIDTFKKFTDYSSNLIFSNYEDVFGILQKYAFKYTNTFIIGGSQIYKLFYQYINTIYITYIDKKFTTDTFFPKITNDFSLVNFSEKTFNNLENCFYRFMKFEKTQNIIEFDKSYLNLTRKIINNYSLPRENRTNTTTLSTFGDKIVFDISTYVPLLTTKRMAWKSCIEELLWFLRGDTDANILKKKNVNIWNGNSSREFLDSVGLNHLQDGDCGANYSFQWRFFGQKYINCNTEYTKNTEGDQIANIIHLLKTNPTSRRIFLSSWNPCNLNKTVLPPCHVSAQFYVDNDKGLSCHMYQRSCDVFLGLPFNIFSYSVLIYILAKKCDLIPKKLIISFGDAHIYSNHIDQVNLQLKRTILSTPILAINDNIKHKKFEDITIDDFEIIGYFPHPSIKGEMAI